jgi:hypothetical protein
MSLLPNRVAAASPTHSERPAKIPARAHDFIPPKAWFKAEEGKQVYSGYFFCLFHWWKKGLPFDPFVPNQIRSAAKGSISLGSFENVGQGALVPVQKGPSVPVSSNSRD